MKEEKDKPKSWSAKIILVLCLILSIIVYVGIIFFLYWVEITSKRLTGLLIVAPFLAIILIATVIFFVKRTYFFDKGFYGKTMLYPSDACQLVKKHFLDEKGVLVDVIPRINMAKSTKTGQEPVMQGYLFHKPTDRLETFTVPLNQGEEAILKGMMNIWDDHPLVFDQKKEDQFIGDRPTPPDIATFSGLTPEEKMRALAAVGKETPNIIVQPANIEYSPPQIVETKKKEVEDDDA